jgi:hypothetical protein
MRAALSTANRRIDFRRTPIQVGVLVTLFLVPVWGRLPGAPPPFSADYATGFTIFFPMLFTVVWWLLAGVPGLDDLRRDRLRVWWALALLGFALWACASTQWAFMRETRPEVAQGVALQVVLAALFAIVVACSGPPARWIAAVLIAGMVLHGSIGGLQVMRQGAIGLHMFSEFTLDPAQSGVSVIQAGGVSWLRAYGLSAHPNMLAGFLVTGLLATCAWIVVGRGWRRWLACAIFVFALWMLLLTFSRGAWIGLAAGMLVLLPVLARYHLQTINRRHTLVVLLLAAMLGVAFFVMYRPFLLARAGVGAEFTEVQSISQRVLLNHIAQEAIREYPVLGVGSGNFPWYASHYLFFRTEYDLTGDHVHQVFTSAQAELGPPGLVLLMLILVLGVEAALRHPTEEVDSASRYALLAGVIAFAVIGLFDHYTWSMLHFQALWWALLAAGGRVTMERKQT